MKRILTKGQLSLFIIFAVLIIDQIIKIWVKTHMFWHESIRITDWFFIYFTENNGMAFGMEFIGKLFLTSFRIVAVALIIWYLVKIIRQNLKTGYIVCISLILAGAIGNIIDCVFYGKIWEYAGWFHGRVVDMLYFPLICNAAGECLFFRPVFNIADSFITVAVFLIILFYRKDLDASLSEIGKRKSKS